MGIERGIRKTAGAAGTARLCGLLLAIAAALLAMGGIAHAASPADASNSALDRLSYAVGGVESSHGADPRMWRAAPQGPQGPMQVSAAAAADLGGGNRFDEDENRALGRAYLDRLYRHYGNWPDAVAAYNWGPGNMDAWIGAGRRPGRLPLGVSLYRLRVFSSALSGGGATPRRLGIVHRQPRRPIADLRHPGSDTLAVERLYRTILKASVDRR